MMKLLLALAVACALVWGLTAVNAQNAEVDPGPPAPGTPANGEISNDPEAGYGLEHLGSPSYRKQARRTREQEMPPWDPYAPQERPWFLSEGVQQELGFRPQEVEPLYEDYQAVWQRHQERQAKLEQGKSQAEKRLEEQAELARQIRTEFDADLGQTTRRYLNDAQRQRMDQLSFQYRGINALSDPAYIDYFGFDANQRRQIAGLQQDFNRRLGALRQFTGTPEERRAAFDRLRQRTAQDLDRLLTDRQRRAFQQMQGDPYQFSDTDYLGTAGDLDTSPRMRSQRGQTAGTRQTGTPGSGIGLSGGRTPGSGVGVPQPNQPGAGTGPTDSGYDNAEPGTPGTAGDIDGGNAAGSGAAGAGGPGTGAAGSGATGGGATGGGATGGGASGGGAPGGGASGGGAGGGSGGRG